MLDYEKIKDNKIKENIKYLKANYRDEDFQNKIDKHCKKFGIQKEDIEQRIIEGDLITLSIFSKDPSKQNFYEKTAAEYIEQIDGVYDFKNLPNGGKHSLFIVEDKILSKIEKDNIDRELPSKSVDFKWKFRTEYNSFYAYHKYIKENGGAQDNQYADVLYSIIAARKIDSQAEHKVLFICDGEYFTEARILKLKDGVKNNNHFVLTINELADFLQK